MKLPHILLVSVLMAFNGLLAQESFDDGLKKLVQEVTEKVSQKHLQSVAMSFFVDDDNTHARLGNYIDEEFSVYFINNRSRIAVTDRFNTDRMMRTSKVILEGTIDQKTVREFGRNSGVQAIVTGRFTVLNESIRVRVKVIDTASGNQIAAAAASLPIDDTVKQLLSPK